MVEFSPAGQSSRAGSITTAAQALGIALAMLVGGGLIQYAPFPTRLNFWTLFVVIAAVFAATWFLPRHTSGEASGKWRPKAPFIPKGLRWIFTISTTAVTMCYALGALMLAMGAQMAHDLIGSDNVLVNGAAMSTFPVVWAVVGVQARRLLPSKSMILGGAASMCGVLLLVLSSSYHGLLIFLAANALAGIGYSLAFTGGLNLLNAHAPPHHRGGTLSALFLIAYLIQGATALILGVVATEWGLKTSIELGSMTLALFGALVAALGFSGPGINPPARSFEQSSRVNSTS
jgi:MFS family permease